MWTGSNETNFFKWRLNYRNSFLSYWKTVITILTQISTFSENWGKNRKFSDKNRGRHDGGGWQHWEWDSKHTSPIRDLSTVSQVRLETRGTYINFSEKLTQVLNSPTLRLSLPDIDKQWLEEGVFSPRRNVVVTLAGSWKSCSVSSDNCNYGVKVESTAHRLLWCASVFVASRNVCRRCEEPGGTSQYSTCSSKLCCRPSNN